MRRKFRYDGRTYEVDGARSEWVLRFWDDGGADMGSVRNRAGAGLDELTDAELCQHLAKASKEDVSSLFSNR
jgi:hypothetical protein